MASDLRADKTEPTPVGPDPGLMGGRCRQCSPRMLSVWAKPVELLQDCLVWDCVPRWCVRWEATLPALGETWWLLVSFPEWPELQSQKEGVFWSPCNMYNYMSDRSSQNLIHVCNTALVVVDLYEVWWACSYVIYIMYGVWLCCRSVVIVYKWTGWLKLTNSARASYGSIF